MSASETTREVYCAAAGAFRQFARLLLCLQVVFAVFLYSGTAQSAGLASKDIKALLPSIVAVIPVISGRPVNLEEPEGSGVVVGNGRQVLTADHIIGTAAQVRIRTNDGVVADAAIVSRDSGTDLALLEMSIDLPALEFAGYPSIGDPACAIGNAFGLGMSVTCGTVSAIRRSGVGFNAIEDFVQTDAAVNPGMSGGALIDGSGDLVGILSAIFTKQSDANIGVNFAVSAPLSVLVLRRLQTGNPHPWPRAGLRLRQFPPRGGTGRSGAVIVDVLPDSAASRAGFRVGDIVAQAGKRRVFGPADFRTAVAMQPSSVPMRVVVVREEKDLIVDLVIDR